ncbi:hypothetical protein PNC201_22475 (plasmid) [Pseudoalteromonas sp. NC201]|nr:hypothetical protein PNC201_22475 [Pseudoalteromonas sp. NC201]
MKYTIVALSVLLVGCSGNPNIRILEIAASIWLELPNFFRMRSLLRSI